MDQSSFQGAAEETGRKIDETLGSIQQSYGGLMEDLAAFATRLRQRTREQPITAILAAAALGYLIGRIGRWI